MHYVIGGDSSQASHPHPCVAWFMAEIGWISFLSRHPGSGVKCPDLRQMVTTSLVVPARNLQNNFAIWLRESE